MSNSPKILFLNFGTYGDFHQGRFLTNRLEAKNCQIFHLGPEEFLKSTPSASGKPLLPAGLIDETLKSSFDKETVQTRTGKFIDTICEHMTHIPETIKQLLKAEKFDLILTHYFYIYALPELLPLFEEHARVAFFHLTPAPLDPVCLEREDIPNYISMPMDRLFDPEELTPPRHWHMSRLWSPAHHLEFSSDQHEVKLLPDAPFATVSLGSFSKIVSADTLNLIVNVLGKIDYQFVIDGEWGITDWPANISNVKHVPHSALFKRTSLLITHCSAGVALKALTARLRMVCLPQFADQQILSKICYFKGNASSVICPELLEERRLRRAVEDGLNTTNAPSSFELDGYNSIEDTVAHIMRLFS